MAPPPRPRQLRRDVVPTHFKSSKPITLNETGRPTTLVPNIQSISWSPTGAMVANGMANQIRVWNPERPDVKSSTEMRDAGTGKAVAHSVSVERVTFNPRSEAVLASIGKDGMVKVWDVRLPGGGAAMGALGGAVGASGKGGITPKAGEHNLGDQGLFLTWHPAGTQLLAGTHKDIVMALDLRKADTAMLEVPTVTINTTANANASKDSIKYELAAMERTPTKEGSDERKFSYNQMAFSNSGRELLCTTSEGPVRIFDYPSLEPLHILKAHAAQTYSVRHSPTGQYIAVGSADSLVTLWDTASWMVSHVLTNQTTSARDLSFSFDGAYLVCGAMSDGKGEPAEKGLHIYHVDTGESVHVIETSNTVRDVAWHPLRYAVAYSGDPGGLKIVGGLTGS